MKVVGYYGIARDEDGNALGPFLSPVKAFGATEPVVLLSEARHDGGAVDHATAMEGWQSALEDAEEAAAYHGNDPRVAKRIQHSAEWIKAHPPRAAASEAQQPGREGELLARAWFHARPEDDDYDIYDAKDRCCEKCVPVLIVRDTALQAAKGREGVE